MATSKTTSKRTEKQIAGIVAVLDAQMLSRAWPKAEKLKLARGVLRIDQAHAARERRAVRAAYQVLRVEFPKLSVERLKGLAAALMFDVRLAERQTS